MKGHRKRILAWVATAALMLAACSSASKHDESGDAEMSVDRSATVTGSPGL